ncbi:PDC sensor domain-containing protein [Leptolyngbya sp. AN02str]|uniref:PDC sensor domain-containing protein n=1 Tax=Leptolyngbya sp. AN02str TaxID=3423363 RepID=UPI003D313341
MESTLQHPMELNEVARLNTAVDKLSHRLLSTIGQQVHDHLTHYLTLPHQLNQLNAGLMLSGQLDINDLKASSQHFWRQAKIFENFSYIGAAIVSGKEAGAGIWVTGVDLSVYENPGGKGYDYAADDQGNATHLIQSYDYDPFGEPWRKKIMAEGKPAWTPVYTTEIATDVVDGGQELEQDQFSNVGYEYYVCLNAEYPLVNRDGTLLGFTVVDLLVTDIGKFLANLPISAAGQVFVMERDGMLVASSSAYPMLYKLDGTATRYSVFNTPDPVVKAVGTALTQKFQDFHTIQTTQQFDFSQESGDRQFVHIAPWQDEYGLDWLVVVTLPESDFV